MHDFGAAFAEAFRLVLTGDPALLAIVGLSLRVTLSAVAIACVVGLPLGALLAVARFPGRGALVVLFTAMMGLPPVVVGLLVYLLLSNAGPLGVLQLLYTPTAMIVAQAVLVTPIVVALSRQVIEDLHQEYDEQLRAMGIGPLGQALTLLWDGRTSLLTAAVTATEIAISTVPSPTASPRFPFDVSSAIAVVITRVTWLMLPPTMITAPTSAMARPKPARATVSRL